MENQKQAATRKNLRVLLVVLNTAVIFCRVMSALCVCASLIPVFGLLWLAGTIALHWDKFIRHMGHDVSWASLLWILFQLFAVWIVMLLAAGMAAHFARSSRKEVKRFRKLHSGLLSLSLTASESLVRASSEPIEEQRAVLLRAAASGQQTPVEQLVRPVGGEQT